MLRLRARSRLILCWVAIWAIVLGGTTSVAARPPVDRPGADGTLTGHEVCTAAGLAFDESSGAGGPQLPAERPAGHDAAGHAGHCIFCSLHADTLAPPTATPSGLALGSGEPTPPRVRPFPLPRRDDWGAAQPRAPPPIG